jgi:hypothetical protein
MGQGRFHLGFSVQVSAFLFSLLTPETLKYGARPVEFRYADPPEA